MQSQHGIRWKVRGNASPESLQMAWLQAITIAVRGYSLAYVSEGTHACATGGQPAERLVGDFTAIPYRDERSGCACTFAYPADYVQVHP